MTDLDTATPTTPQPAGREQWLTRGTAGIGTACLLADVGHEIPTSLLPSLLTSTLHAPASALGVIEGIADALAGAARLGGGALADDPHRRRRVAIGGYSLTAVLSSLIGVATSVWQVAILRAGAWTARGLRVPARNALLADIVPPAVYGRAYGFERAMDNLGAIIGPLLGIVLVTLTSVRAAILISVIPGLLAGVAILYAIRHTPQPERREHQPIRLHVRSVLTGRMRTLMVGIGAFELGNMASTLLILRATELLTPGHGKTGAVQLALALYTAYDIAATLISIPAGALGDRHGSQRVLLAGAAGFLASYIVLAVTGPSVPLLAIGFVLAGIAIGRRDRRDHRDCPSGPRRRARLGVRDARRDPERRELGRERDRRDSLDRDLSGRRFPVRSRPGTAFDPDNIAELFWTAHTDPTDAWQTEYRFTGA